MDQEAYDRYRGASHREQWDDECDNTGGLYAFLRAVALATCITAAAIALGLAAAWFAVQPASAHDWYPPRCCSGFDCKPIDMQNVQTTPEGFVIPGNPEVVPYSSPKIRRTPPEGENKYHICTKGGKIEGEVLCLYIPNWGA